MNIIGASGHGKVILDTLHLIGINVVDIWDDNTRIGEFMGLQVKGNIHACVEANVQPVIIAVGNNKIRKKIAALFQSSSVFGRALHPSAEIAGDVEIGEGTVVMANGSINASCNIGRHVIINTNASVDHDCVIGDYVHISPQVGLAGNVEVGEGTHIGIGACVIQGIKIGKWCTIGAGAVIIKDIPDGSTVVGNPGKIIKSGLQGAANYE